MNETTLVRDVLADKSHPAHVAAKSMMEGLKDGSINMCGCLGPMYGEPYCACQMKQQGLEAAMDNNPLRIAEEARSKKQWEEFIAKGGFSRYESE
jgi:hypothetical protein